LPNHWDCTPDNDEDDAAGCTCPVGGGGRADAAVGDLQDRVRQSHHHEGDVGGGGHDGMGGDCQQIHHRRHWGRSFHHHDDRTTASCAGVLDVDDHLVVRPDGCREGRVMTGRHLGLVVSVGEY